MKIYIVAWEYIGGGGFDWYWEKKIAKKMYQEEKRNEKEFKRTKWTAYYREIDLTMFSDEITNMIDGILWTKIIKEEK